MTGPLSTEDRTIPEQAVEAAARAMDPDAFNDDPKIRHRHCSPYKVEVVQDSARHNARLVLTVASPHMGAGVGVGDLEKIADAIDEARYQHPTHPRVRPHSFGEADETDREYAFRLARAALPFLSARTGAVADAVAAERQRCAQIAEEMTRGIRPYVRSDRDELIPCKIAERILNGASPAPTALPGREEVARAADNFHDLLAIFQTKLAKIIDPEEHPYGKQLMVEFLDKCIASRDDLRRLALGSLPAGAVPAGMADMERAIAEAICCHEGCAHVRYPKLNRSCVATAVCPELRRAVTAAVTPFLSAAPSLHSVQAGEVWREIESAPVKPNNKHDTEGNWLIGYTSWGQHVGKFHEWSGPIENVGGEWEFANAYADVFPRPTHWRPWPTDRPLNVPLPSPPAEAIADQPGEVKS